MINPLKLTDYHILSSRAPTTMTDTSKSSLVEKVNERIGDRSLNTRQVVQIVLIVLKEVYPNRLSDQEKKDFLFEVLKIVLPNENQVTLQEAIADAVWSDDCCCIL